MYTGQQLAAPKIYCVLIIHSFTRQICAEGISAPGTGLSALYALFQHIYKTGTVSLTALARELRKVHTLHDWMC